MKKNVKIILVIGILLMAGIGIYLGFFYENSDVYEFPSNTACVQTYLELCSNQSDPAFGCNMETKTCNKEELILVTFISRLEEQNIKIYGATWCPACKKQLEDFGIYKDYLIERGIFVYCDVEPINPECNNIQSIPAWKQNGEIFQVGYLDIEEFISKALNSTEV